MKLHAGIFSRRQSQNLLVCRSEKKFKKHCLIYIFEFVFLLNQSPAIEINIKSISLFTNCKRYDSTVKATIAI